MPTYRRACALLNKNNNNNIHFCTSAIKKRGRGGMAGSLEYAQTHLQSPFPFPFLILIHTLRPLERRAAWRRASWRPDSCLSQTGRAASLAVSCTLGYVAGQACVLFRGLQQLAKSFGQAGGEGASRTPHHLVLIGIKAGTAPAHTRTCTND